MTPPIIRVALDAPMDQLFDYQAADAGQEDVGRRVRVPFGRREQVGVIVALVDQPGVATEQLRAAHAIDRALPPLPPDLLNLARFAAGYYHHPLGPTLLGILPPALKRQRYRPPAPAAYRLTEAGRAHAAGLPPRAHAQRRLAALLAQGPQAPDRLAELRPSLRDWLKRGLVEAIDVGAADHAPPGPPPPALSPAQSQVLATLSADPTGFRVDLLHGVTGSGKTEVYLRLMEQVLAQGRQILLLVPEIHLTPQLLERVRQRFPTRRLVGLHSGLGDGERLAGWLDCLAGRAELILGTRLAVFAPLPKPGLIIVDEEHDAAYKQMEGLRYHARDVAVWRARQRDIPILLGSATPALETWANAQRDRYRLLSLPERAHAEATLPQVRLIDIRTDKAKRGLSAALQRALAENLARGEQSLLFINRRGFAPVLRCQACGHVSQCPRCSARQVIHRLGAGSPRHAFQLRCHHCGLAARPPEACPACGSLDLRPTGQGTQRLEDHLADVFPDARILRIDRDSTSRKGAFAAMREAIAARQVDILVGTQIVAKGHDFPQLTLVGVVGADQALMSSDFRATERLFAQLMQVGGRAGRAAQPGQVLIQTEYPHHPLYAALAAHDYPAFAALTLAERRAMELPPYGHQALLRCDAPSMAAALAFLDQARALAGAPTPDVTLFDPSPAIMPRVANRERAQLLLQSASRAHLQAFLGGWVASLRQLKCRGLRWSLDVDPLDL